MTRAVLFDLDDTLLDFRQPMRPRALFDAGAARIYAALTSLGCSLPSFEPFCRRQRAIARRIDWMTWLTGGEPDGRRLLRRLCKDYRLQRDETSLAKLGWIWYQPTADATVLAPDVIPTLAALRDAEVKLGLVVNTPHLGAVIDQHLDLLGLMPFFPLRIYSSEIEARKPHPRPFKAALEQLGVSAKETIFVGNDPAIDLAGARRVGMQTVLRSKNPAPRACKHADHCIERIEQLLDIFELVVERPADAPMTLPPLRVPAAQIN